MSDEYTPSMDEIRVLWAQEVDPKSFDRAIAAHDRALREQIARDIEATAKRVLSAPVEPGDFGVKAVIAEGVKRAARIARVEQTND